jgi:dolichol kinase
MLLTELRRKLVHLSGLLVIIPLIYLDREWLLKILAFLVAGMLFLYWWVDLRKQRRGQIKNLIAGFFETVYLDGPANNAEAERAEEGFFRGIIDNVMRRNDRVIFLASVYFFLGMLISLIFFSREALVFGIIALCIGDSAAALVGKAWQAWRWPSLGRIPWDKSKTFAGSFGFLAFTFLACFVFLYIFPNFIPLGWIRAGLIAGAVGAFVETIPFVNDNFSIPVAVSWAIWTALSFA